MINILEYLVKFRVGVEFDGTKHARGHGAKNIHLPTKFDKCRDMVARVHSSNLSHVFDERDWAMIFCNHQLKALLNVMEYELLIGRSPPPVLEDVSFIDLTSLDIRSIVSSGELALRLPNVNTLIMGRPFTAKDDMKLFNRLLANLPALDIICFEGELEGNEFYNYGNHNYFYLKNNKRLRHIIIKFTTTTNTSQTWIPTLLRRWMDTGANRITHECLVNSSGNEYGEVFQNFETYPPVQGPVPIDTLIHGAHHLITLERKSNRDTNPPVVVRRTFLPPGATSLEVYNGW